MQIKQWKDDNLAQYSYGILSDCEKKIALIDPARDVEPYINWAKENDAEIIAIIETHPHADFVSGHLELHKRTGATIYTHSLAGAAYPHSTFDDGASIEFGKIKLTSLHTPGHSPDGISILLHHNGKQKAVFTGDTLFIGDCGRPDLREGAGNIQAKKEQLARQMFHSLRNKLMTLDDEVLVYPAHGAGTLCGKNLSEENSSTIGAEKQTNWSLQITDEEAFVENLLKDQPFVPAYFPFDVELNRQGAPDLIQSISDIEIKEAAAHAPEEENKHWIVDARDEKEYKSGHLPRSVNIMEDGKFETWLGTIIKPAEPFYIAAKDEAQLQRLFKRAAAIGYEDQIRKGLVVQKAVVTGQKFDAEEFKRKKDAYTIIDVRNNAERKNSKSFAHSISIPLPEMRNRISEIPQDKPIVVHCAGGYRSAIGSSMIKSELNGKVAVYDMGEAVKKLL